MFRSKSVLAPVVLWNAIKYHEVPLRLGKG